MADKRIEAFLQNQGSRLFIGYMLTALIPILLYKTEFNAPYVFALKFLGAPIVAICFFVYLNWMPSFRAKSSLIAGVGLTLVFSALIVLMSGGYVLLVNAWGPAQSHRHIQGTIVGLDVSRGRSYTGYLVSVSGVTGEPVKVEVTRGEYDQLSLGQEYSKDWNVGALGILYR